MAKSLKTNILLIFFLFTVLVSAEVQIPKLSQRVTDQTNTLTQSEINQLSALLQAFEDSTSNQLVVLIMETLDNYPIEDFAYQVGEQNKIGQKGRDNGIILLIVKSDREVRIEVGYGLEGALPDATASSIIRNEMIPFFKNNDYYGGITTGVNSIIKATKGEYQAIPKKEKNKKSPINFQTILFIIFIILSLFGRKRRRGVFFGGFPGGGFGGGGFGGFGGGGGGFGGFSGGGGSFGGGGASGRW